MTHDAFAQHPSPEVDRRRETQRDNQRASAEELAAVRSQITAQLRGSLAGGDDFTDDPIPNSIGRFQILRRIGSGNYGCVYLAYDSRLTRQVAIKVSHLGEHTSGDLRGRFIREAHAAARLAHQNVVCLHEYGEEQGVLYLVYEMCEGPTLEDWSASQSEPIALNIAAAIVREIANGLAHAHQRGLVHRDVKPNNVLLPPNHDESGSLPFIPRVTDFGLAHDSLSVEQKSLSARLVGTVEFMSPEQARGEVRTVTPASDQYSLGVILYQLLTGKLPIQGENFVEHLQRICRDQPRSPRSLRREVPRDLAAITLTCLNKSPGLRYRSCRELARDLDRFLRGAPVHARPLRFYQRACRNICAAPIVSSLIGLIVMGCLISALVFSQLASNLKAQQGELKQTLSELTISKSKADLARQETERALETAKRQQQQAEQHARQAVLQAYRADMHRAYEAWNKRQVLETTQILASIAEHLVDFMEPGFDFRLLANNAHNAALEMTSHSAPATDVKPIPGTPWIVSADQSGQLLFHHGVTGELVHSTSVGQAGEINSLDVSADGTQLAVGTQHGLLGLNYAVVYALQCAGRDSWLGDSTAMYYSPTVVESLQFSPDSHWLALGPRYLPVMLYDTQTQKLQHSLATKSRNRTVDFSPDGQQCLVLGSEDNLLIYQVESGELVRSVPCGGSTQAARWSPAGDWLAYSLYSDSVVRLVSNTAPYPSIELTQSRGAIESLCFSDDGEWLAAGTRRGGVASWSLRELSKDSPPAQLACVSQSVTHSNDVAALCIDQQGRVTSVSDIGSVASERLASGGAASIGDDVVVATVDFYDSRPFLVRGMRDGSVVRTEMVLGQVDEGTSHELIGSSSCAVSALACDSSRRKLAVGWVDGCVSFVDLASGMHTECSYASPSDSLDQRQVNSLSFSEDGTHLSACGDDARVRVWKLDQPQRPQWEHRLTSLAYATCFCGPNRVAVGGMFEQILVFDVASGSIVHRVEGAQRSGCMMYDAERQRLISGHGDGRLRVHEGPEFTSRYTLNADAGEIKCIARSPDNACYLSGDVQGNLRLWSAEHCELVGNIHTCPKQSIIAGLQWNTFQQELIVFFFGDALGDPAQPSSGLHLRAFSAR